ncbi:MAG: DUF975 family protein [Solobacterium sp.]|jgi:uncharacterized membrane protein|nr:DUF975 family protein [Solobacterium sp.]MCH4222797.1 DUF975 family protein [Solobacterium sp.]MCH4266181.1 DUF975 family protein [Solobacterium sp.]
MLSTRAQLKTEAKGIIKNHYWPAVGAGIVLLLSAGTGAANGRSSRVTYHFEDGDTLRQLVSTTNGYFIACVLVIIALVIVVFVLHPLEYGASAWFLRAMENNDSEKGMITSGFHQDNYMRTVETLFFRNLFIFLWGLLLVIPGIVKHYEYYFVPYLLADHPEMSGKEVLALSKEMTMGHKMDLFVLDLSFILWYILNSFTLGLTNIFFVAPYVCETQALCYADLVASGADPTRPDGADSNSIFNTTAN